MSNFQAKSTSLLPKNISVVIKLTKENGGTIVLVTGVFDILHIEHQSFIRKAKALGDTLIIAIESDKRVAKMKGEGRPINNSNRRVQKLLDLALTKNIFVLPDEFDRPEDHVSLIKTIRPDILAVSSHTAHLDKKKQIMDLVDGKLVVVHEHNPDISSTKIINKI